MKNNKPFKTIDEQLQILRERNVVIVDENEVGRYLLEHSYYAVVNGYKDPFLDREKSEELGHDYYKNGTFFESFKLLYLFDSVLRIRTRKLLLQAETIMKNATVYAFCYRNREPEAYLDPLSYCLKSDYAYKNRYTSSLIGLLSTLQRCRDNKQGKEYVSHYAEKHKAVPLWVLQNTLTFGNMSAFFDLQKPNVQNDACKHVVKISKLDKRSLGIKDMRKAFRVLSSFRNICAHEERLYCARIGRNKYTFKDMLSLLQKVLPRENMKDFAIGLIDLIAMFDDDPDIRQTVYDGMKLDETYLKEVAGL